MVFCLALGLQVVGVLGLDVLPASRERPLAQDWLTARAGGPARVFRDAEGTRVFLDNGLLRRTFLLLPGETPGIVSVGLDDLAKDSAWLRAVSPEAAVTIDGTEFFVGGPAGHAPGQDSAAQGRTAQPDGAFIDPSWVAGWVASWMESLQSAAATGPGTERDFALDSIDTGPIGDLEIPWSPNVARHCAPDAVWPPRGTQLVLNFSSSAEAASQVQVQVHYALFDGLPAYAKWLTVKNLGEKTITIDSMTTEMLRVVEHSSWVETRGAEQPTPSLHVETDYSFGGMTHRNANGHVVHWRTDPTFLSQVNYERKTPCLLEVSPNLGPAAPVAPGETFTSFRTFVLSVHESDGRERVGMARRRLMRTVAPWVTENPLMMHVRWSDQETVRNAIDQCAEVGFEMVILTFGSGFNIENTAPDYLAEMKAHADYARSKGVEIGGYSLLSSRRIEPAGDNCLHPETGQPGADIHGSCPSLTSDWGQNYFATLERFYDETGFMLLEHDGSYPGTPDAASRPPLQTGLDHSVWAQWQVIDGFYRWCRGRGIYLNVPDHYYHAGANKCGMGYREVNWSLPRAAQVIHTRQNIYDGTWTKTPSMGWMFVPLTEYQGGGDAATIEPLSEHLDHYRRMLMSNLALGVQACYRGPRLYDTDATRAMVKETVSWFKQHRRLLESDVVHGRRADGRDLDWMLHVDPLAPDGEPRGMLVAFNPLEEAVERTLRVPLELTGIRGTAYAEGPGLAAPAAPAPGDSPTALELDGLHAYVTVRVPAGSTSWVTLR